MLILLSPSKSQDFTSPLPKANYTEPLCLEQSLQLIEKLRGLSQSQISALMGVSAKIAALNVERYAHFSVPFTPENARQALFSFTGDVYTDIESDQYSAGELDFAQKHLRILSGLYGVLRPLDLIQPYRLEMGTKLPTRRGKDLLAFWGERLTMLLNQQLAEQGEQVVVNLASQEYFSSIQPKKLKATLITPHFKEARPEGFKIIGIYAKRARGAMTNYIIRHGVTEPQKLQQFSETGYEFNEALSSETDYVFTR
jgi:cytoplasmic iron level regulating protein YaaA (DUF328/UPF0246 family)